MLMGAIGIAAIVAMPLVVAAAAQWPHHGWHHGWAMYDEQTATRVAGTVEAVKNVTVPDDARCCGVGGGTHITLKTTTESIEAESTWRRSVSWVDSR